MEIWEDYDRVYHYTTLAGLKGILDTQSLHATHYKYVNDSTEMARMLPKLVELLHPVAREIILALSKQHPEVAAKVKKLGGLEAASRSETEKFVRMLSRVTFGSPMQNRSYYQPYMVSFCGHKSPYERANGLLSQWRAYGKDTGYALVFKTKELVDLLKAECARYVYSPGHMSDVVYEGDEEGFKKEFQNLVDVSRNLIRSILLGIDANFEPLYIPFITGVSRYKHEGFREEQEVRILVSPLSRLDAEEVKRKDPKSWEPHAHKTLKEVHFRDNLSPYIALFGGEKESLPIERIIVGPHANKELRAERLKKYLAIKDISIEVSCSQTPFM